MAETYSPTDQSVYIDQMDRPIAASSRMLSGGYNRIDREYDALGRVHRESLPCWWSGCTQYWATSTYDLLNRVTLTQRPVSDSDPTPSTTASYYEGLTTRVIDALGKQSTVVNNVAGLMARSSDHSGYYQNFDYNSFGDVLRVMDSASSTLVSNTYNIRGMRTAQTDMDMGAWVYTPNALGEVVSQTDAKSQTTTFIYDLLGRMTSRTEPDGSGTATSTFTFGTSVALRNIGRLQSMSAPGHTEGFTYDNWGRPSQRTITSDATYQINYTYNSIGALDTLTYPTSTASTRVKLRYNYQNGLVQSVRDYTGDVPGTVYWQAHSTDESNQIIDEQLGNGLRTISSYDRITGLLENRTTGTSSSTSNRQNSEYYWNEIGNLTQRRELNLNHIESFYYDSLHRLDYSQLNGATNLDVAYDAMGNITSKTGVGAYSYHATKKHAVVSAGSNTYAYDANGNMTSRNGATIAWASYNLPTTINQAGGLYSQFSYAADRSRYKQIAVSAAFGTETTMYVGGIFERVTRSTGTEYKHYVSTPSGPVAVINRKSTGANEVFYLLRDHLGSTEMITSSTGGQLARLSNDAFGRRRNGGSWASNPAASESSAFYNNTHRGFTGHEHLDNLALVHMNGRVYDPVVGRFLSADPIIQFPDFTQSFNRYSYVLNNPLSYTDPSGFDTDKGKVEKCEHACPGSGGTNGDGRPDAGTRQYGASGFLSGTSTNRVNVYQPQTATQNHPGRTGPTLHLPWAFSHLGHAGAARNVGDGYLAGDRGSGGGSQSGSTVGGNPFTRFAEPGSFSASAGYAFYSDPNISDDTKANVAAVGFILMTAGAGLNAGPLLAVPLGFGLEVQGIADGMPGRFGSSTAGAMGRRTFDDAVSALRHRLALLGQASLPDRSTARQH